MIKMLTAFTRNVHDADAAVADVLKQLDLDNRRLANSVGILIFHPDFLASGVVEAVSKALPFNTIGGTTAASTSPDVAGNLVFTLSVLTSDTVVFRSGMSRAINEDATGPVAELYSRVAPPEMGRPSLLFTIAPIVDTATGDDLVTAIDAASGGVPLFGTLAFTHEFPELSSVATCANGVSGARSLTLIALFGEVNPRFYVTTIPQDRAIHGVALITQSEKNQIRRINGFVPINYLEKVGLVERNQFTAGVANYPFTLTLKDGSKVVRAVYKVTDEGYILSFSNVPQGVRVSFSQIDADFVVESTKNTIAQVVAESSAENVLIFSCTGRRWALAEDEDAEMMEIGRDIGYLLSYHFAYAGGEICPVKNSKGEMVNNFHSFTLIACAF
ncbi:MAG: FIST C-terminal domain-containing protein [Candidatus Accumulibacter sp.]|jgi:hypothetical protein|nr:FIST C-terminal domain-containing protein [Accumulibacter sp.]